jgi:hypothetical protein
MHSLKLPVDHTLSIITNAAVSRGLTHKITRNLRWLRQSHVLWVEKSYYSHKPFWKPQLPSTSTQYQPYSLPTPGSKHDLILGRNRKTRLFDEQCSNALGEVIKMAEGRHGIILGRLRLKRWQQEWSWLSVRNLDFRLVYDWLPSMKVDDLFFCWLIHLLWSL